MRGVTFKTTIVSEFSSGGDVQSTALRADKISFFFISTKFVWQRSFLTRYRESSIYFFKNIFCDKKYLLS